MAKETKTSGFSLKDELFNRNRVQYLAQLFKASDADFDATGFVRNTLHKFKPLELKERIVRIAEQLEHYLSPDFRQAAKQINDALPPPLDPTRTDDDFGDFIFAPLGEFVVRNGLKKRFLKLSLKTLKNITQRFSMEDAIRAFINSFPDETLEELTRWTQDKNYHVRRLVSEGTRAMLPWSKRLEIEITVPLPLLDALHADPTRYVTRSVSNHLNDIAKSRSELVVDRLQQWKELARQDPKELNWMSRHALRTLVKQGNRQALEFLGFRANPKIVVSGFNLSATEIKPGQTLEFSFSVTAQRDESLMVDYVVDFVKANGSTAPKVHKLKQIELKKGETVKLAKRHPLRANATTYTLYPGTHRVTLQINGRPFGSKGFELT